MLIILLKYNKLYQKIVIGLALLCISIPALSALPDESEIGISLEKSVGFGTPTWLTNGGSRFFSIYTPDQTGRPKGAAIVLHGANAHPDWPDVVNPIRTYLPRHGWATLSIQLPPMETIEDYSRIQQIVNNRIDKATEFLRNKGFGNVALIGYGTGAMGGSAYLANVTNRIQGFVGISLSVLANLEEGTESVPEQLSKIKIPMLDIYGSRDLEQVTRFAFKRAMAVNEARGITPPPGSELIDTREIQYESSFRPVSSTSQRTYRQIKIYGADHHFTGHQRTLSKRVLGWLDRYTKGVVIDTASNTERTY